MGCVQPSSTETLKPHNASSVYPGEAPQVQSHPNSNSPTKHNLAEIEERIRSEEKARMQEQIRAMEADREAERVRLEEKIRAEERRRFEEEISKQKQSQTQKQAEIQKKIREDQRKKLESSTVHPVQPVIVETAKIEVKPEKNLHPPPAASPAKVQNQAAEKPTLIAPTKIEVKQSKHPQPTLKAQPSSSETTLSTIPQRVDLSCSMFSHYLNYESAVSHLASPDLLLKRIISKHNDVIRTLVCRSGKSNLHRLNDGLRQRIFLDCIDEAQKEFFVDKLSYDTVRRKIAERYLFENYEMFEFTNCESAYVREIMSLAFLTAQHKLSASLTASDYTLYWLLKELKERFPQVADNSSIEFPTVNERKQDVNLLNNIPNKKCFSDPKHMNFNTTLFDIEFLIERAISEFSDFKTDMKALLGEQALVDAKVKSELRDGQKVYAASAVRRVFIKWVETIFERIPNIRLMRVYKNFVQSKWKIFDEFCIKTEFTQSIQQSILEVLLELIEIAKFTLKEDGSFVENPMFGFFIYDLLRCKIHRGTPGEIMKVLEDMCNTAKTKTGKNFKVVRIKNRFKTPNRDLMVNFCYGDVIVGEAQLCVDNSDVNQKAQKTNKFNHYLYELQRGLLGPTAELMMQYEDFNRPDQVTRLYWMGNLKNRDSNDYETSNIHVLTKKCPVGHEMILAQENLFYKISGAAGIKNEYTNAFLCDFCGQGGNFEQPFLYCQKCSLQYCMRPSCLSLYKNTFSKKKPALEVCNAPAPGLFLQSTADFNNRLKQKNGLLVVFFHPDLAACIVLRDYIVIAYNRANMEKIPYDVTLCDVTKPELKEIVDRYALMKKEEKRESKATSKIASFAMQQSKMKERELTQALMKLPMTVVLDGKGAMLKTLYGASSDIFQCMVQFRNQAAKNAKPKLTLKCVNSFCYFKPVLKLKKADPDFTCIQCLNIPVDDDNPQPTNRTNCFECQACKRSTCLSCGFLGYPEPASYEDPQGASYLSTTVRAPRTLSCSKNHTMAFTRRNVSSKSKHHCSKCNGQFFFTREYGMGYCRECSEFACERCLGMAADLPNRFGKEAVSFFMEYHSPETRRCEGCKDHFKKVYCNRALPEDDADFQSSGEFVQQTKKAGNNRLYNEFNRKMTLGEWKCCYCQSHLQQGIIHLACVPCNYQMCMSCAKKFDIFRNSTKFVEQTPTGFTCQKGHPILSSFKSPTPGATTVTCSCNKTIYPNSQHFVCNTCREFWCQGCAGNFKSNSWVCMKGHELIQRNRNPTGLALVCGYDSNHIIFKNQPFWTCPQCEDYVLCQKYKCKGPNVKNLKCPLGHRDPGIMLKRPFECVNGKDCLYHQKGIQKIISDYAGCKTCELFKDNGFKLCWACLAAKKTKRIEG